MKQVIEALKKTDVEKRIAVLRMEVDYELATLHDALIADDFGKIAECKKNLERFRHELICLEA